MRQQYPRISVLAAVVALLLASCASPNNDIATAPSESATSYEEALPPVLAQALEAHGGLAKWQAQQRLEYDVYRKGRLLDHQLIALRSRKVLLTGEDYTIG